MSTLLFILSSAVFLVFAPIIRAKYKSLPLWCSMGFHSWKSDAPTVSQVQCLKHYTGNDLTRNQATHHERCSRSCLCCGARDERMTRYILALASSDEGASTLLELSTRPVLALTEEKKLMDEALGSASPSTPLPSEKCPRSSSLISAERMSQIFDGVSHQADPTATTKEMYECLPGGFESWKRSA